MKKHIQEGLDSGATWHHVSQREREQQCDSGCLESARSLKSSLGVQKPITVTCEFLGAAAQARSEYTVNGDQKCQCCSCSSRLLAVFSAEVQSVTSMNHQAVYCQDCLYANISPIEVFSTVTPVLAHE